MEWKTTSRDNGFYYKKGAGHRFMARCPAQQQEEKDDGCQYSLGSSAVVTLRSASVITQRRTVSPSAVGTS